MSTYTKLTYHVVFSTKYRRRTIRDDFRERLYQYIGGTIRSKNGHLVEIGGVDDHLHLLVSLTPTTAVADSVRDIKANASRWVNDTVESGQKFEWQKGYSAFTVSCSQIESVRQYLRIQREHHQKTTFEQEYVAFLERHQIEFDRRYLFEDEHHG